MLLTDEQTL